MWIEKLTLRSLPDNLHNWTRKSLSSSLLYTSKHSYIMIYKDTTVIFLYEVFRNMKHTILLSCMLFQGALFWHVSTLHQCALLHHANLWLAPGEKEDLFTVKGERKKIQRWYFRKQIIYMNQSKVHIRRPLKQYQFLYHCCHKQRQGNQSRISSS